MALKPTEIQAVKNYMGYSNITILALPYVEVSAVFETVVQNNLDSFGEDKVRDILSKLSTIEQDIFDARTKYVASELIGDIKINDRHHEKLLALRDWEIDRLAETVRVPRAQSLRRTSTLEVS